MRNRKLIYNALSVAFLVVSVVALIVYSFANHGYRQIDREAKMLSNRLEHRVHSMDNYIAKALSEPSDEWLILGELPSDMVVYRYYSDTLQSWVNEFPVFNDNIVSGTYFPFITNPGRSFVSPLSAITDSLSFVNLGQSWYLAKSGTSYNCKVIAGLEIADIYGRTTRANSELKINGGYSVSPLSDDGGVAVYVGGRPVFKLMSDNMTPGGVRNSSLLWLALVSLIFSSFFFLLAGRSVRRMVVSICMIVSVLAIFFLWGRSGSSILFSPILYASGAFFYSLGAVVLVNLAIILAVSCLFMSREDMSAHLKNDRWKWGFFATFLLFIVGILVYTHFLLGSIILNSNISLELFKPAELSPFSILVYASFITMLMSVPMLVQIAGSVAPSRIRVKMDAFSLGCRIMYALCIAVYLLCMSAVLGFQKEQKRMEGLASRLSFDRDISLEMRLRGVENQIADDMIISALSVFSNSAATIQGRITDTYLSQGEQNYTVSVYVFNESNNTRAALEQYNELLKDGVPIADNSRFMFVKRDNTRSYYVGVFLYLIEDNGISRVLVCLESKNIRGNKGYAGIFGITPPGRVTIPTGYSYALYEGTSLRSSHGSFAYPTKMGADIRTLVYDRRETSFTLDGYTHFITLISDGEVVAISRAKISVITYFVSAILVAIVSFVLLSLLGRGGRKKRNYGWNFFRTRILELLLISLLLTLVSMAAVSVYFVFTRNETNMYTMISDKIMSIASLMEAGTGNVSRTEDMNFPQLRRLMEQVGSDTNSDVTLYSPDGHLLMSTTPMVFERHLLGDRINGTAYSEIMYQHKKYYIQKENAGHVRFYSMYAPIMGRKGNVLAIICSPYNEENYDFEEDAFIHTATVFSIFLLCLMLSLFLVSGIVDKMFSPLTEMSRKMSSADLDSLEQIEYKRNDEIAAIVHAYNRMVVELSESSRKLAQAERDKAWSGMARQVAHEIKNPLTPMKLQLQRVIRLKQKGDPAWQLRFDEASKVILDHIDILTDTANEFSTFAKLYTEPPTLIELDMLIREEIAMFDNKDNIEFLYLGFEDVKVMGPKPQLTRVFVNLINNAVQAIGDSPDGRVTVSLRNSTEPGYYDIVFEDNGPGVSAENESKLFTPNFTTKNGGSGLGLAISRSILEKCGATINYHRSYTLNGACFTIRYPKGMSLDITSDGNKSEPDSR